MRKYDSIEKAILENDIERLREGIGSICYVDGAFSTGEFDEVVNYVLQKGIRLKDSELKGKLVSDKKSNYTEDDFVNAVFELKNNFCDERIRDVKKIGRSLYKKENTDQTKLAKINTKHLTSSSINNKNNTKQIATILAGVISIIAIAKIIQRKRKNNNIDALVNELEDIKKELTDIKKIKEPTKKDIKRAEKLKVRADKIINRIKELKDKE